MARNTTTNNKKTASRKSIPAGKSGVHRKIRSEPAPTLFGKLAGYLGLTLVAIKDFLMRPIRRLLALRRRRTHKSFILSRRRDYVRPLKLPGYFSFTIQVAATLFRNRATFTLLSITSAVLVLVLSGLSSHQLYESMADSIAEDGEALPFLIQAGSLAVSTAGLLSSGAGEAQQVYIAVIGLVTWLATVWLLREIFAGRRPKLRDGLYSSGSPIVATAIVALMLLLQLIPVGLLALVYIALSTTGLIAQGLGAFLFSGVAVLVVTLTLYWVTSTLLAMVIVTLPGMYPWRAMRAASDIVVGRRLRMLYRIIWMLVLVILTWMLVMTPVVILANQLRVTFDWFGYIPLVPMISTWLSMVLVVWASSYLYTLYRKVVASDAESGS